MKKILFVGILLAGCVLSAIAQDDVRPRYSIHKTSDTKTYEIDGSVRKLGNFHDGRAVVAKKKGGYFIINEKGEKIFDLPQGEFPSKWTYDSGMLMVQKKLPKQKEYEQDRYSVLFYDRDGNVVGKFNESISSTTGLRDGVAIVKVKRTEKGGWIQQDVEKPIYINGEGKILSESLSAPTNDYGTKYYIYGLNSGLALAYDEKTKLWGYRDKECHLVIPCKFRNAWSFTADGLAVAKNSDGKYGFINTNGEWVIEPKYSLKPENFHSGRAIIYDKAKNPYFIDKTGTIIWNPPHEYKMHMFMGNFFDNGYGLMSDFDKGKSYLIDTSFKKVAELRGYREQTGFDGITKFKYTDEWWSFYVGWDSKYYLFDYQGNLLQIWGGNDNDDFFSDDGIRAVVSDKSAYYYNIKGEIIARFTDTKF